MIEVKNLTCGYGSKMIVHDISFEIQKGSVCGLIGANGAGKSTLLKCIMGYIKPKTGDVLIEGRSVAGIGEKEMSKKVAYVAQSHDVPFSFTVMEMVLMGRTPHMGGIYQPKETDYEICKEKLKAVGMYKHADEQFQNLSGGQKQLCFLARAFAQDSPIMIMDEPTSNLDYKNQINFWKMVREISKTGKTVFVCVHDPNHVLWFCDDVVALGDGGKLRTSGEVAEVIVSDVLKEVYGIDIDIIRVKDKTQVTLPTMTCS